MSVRFQLRDCFRPLDYGLLATIVMVFPVAFELGLTHEEQVIWKLIRENGYLWKGYRDNVTGEWTWRTDEKNLMFERLREHWDTFKAVAAGEAHKSILPTRAKLKPRG